MHYLFVMNVQYKKLNALFQLSLNGVDVSILSGVDVQAMLKSAGRPVTLKFSEPGAKGGKRSKEQYTEEFHGYSKDACGMIGREEFVNHLAGHWLTVDDASFERVIGRFHGALMTDYPNPNAILDTLHGIPTF